MKSHPAKLIAALLLIGVVSASSQTLNWASLTGSDIVDSKGDPLDNTFVIELGAFDPTFTPDATNVGDWSSYWRVFDTADYSYSPATGGYFTGSAILQDVTSYDSLFAGLTAFLWIRNDTETEHFLATSGDKPGIPSWEFPALDPECCPSGSITTWSVSNFGTDTPIWGSQGDQHGGGDREAQGPFDLQTHVPEPTTALLALLGMGVAMTRRRRSED